MSNQSSTGSVPAREHEARPNWIDEREYPFDSNYLETTAGRMHYVDEGQGPTLLMLHGNPTWSFVYRHLIAGLSDEYRCVAPDYLGFGLSDKPREWSYRPRDHARVVDEFVEELGLSDVTLFVHDWGGPIGVDYATRHPENVDGFVVLNTAAWPMARELRVRAFSKLLGSPVGASLDREYNAVVDWVLPRGFGDRSRLTPAIHDHYRGPLRDPADRRGATAFARELTGSTQWLSSLWDRRWQLAEKPAILCWGLGDPLFGVQQLRRWQALFPHARTVEFPTAGHFVQDERGVQMLPEVEQFLLSEVV